ncbi:transposase IS66 family protein, partial [Yoonia maritima]
MNPVVTELSTGMYCWAHARRKLYELTHNNVAPIAEEGLKQIAAL